MIEKTQRRAAAEELPRPADTPRRRTMRAFRLRRNLALLALAAPALVYLFIFKYATMVGLIVAFKRYRVADGILGSPWVGLENFRFMFGTGVIWGVIRNTLALNLLFLVITTIVSLAVAILINEIYFSKITRVYQTTLFFPQFISWVLVSYFVYVLLSTESGVVNAVLSWFGVAPVRWYSSPQYWPLILLLAAIWKGTGSGSLLYLAGILGIDPQYYEAARLDGASKWQEIRHITLPLLAPVIVVQVLIAIGFIFNADFGLFFQVTRNNVALYPTTDVMDTFVYRSLTKLGNVGMAGAAGLMQAAVGFVLVLASNWLVRRWDPERSLF
jgi:putative aldouronate transport system permease protein